MAADHALAVCGLPTRQPTARVESHLSSVGVRCHELRIVDTDSTCRVMYRTDQDAIVILDVFSTKTPKTPTPVIDVCQRRLQGYDRARQ
jgi:phage-related protein